MPNLATLTEADIQGEFSVNALRKGYELMTSVQNARRVGNTLHATVQGTGYYTVEVEVRPGGFYGECNCPYEWKGHCKHIAAVLLKWLRAPRSFVGDGSLPMPPEVETPQSLEVTLAEPLPSLVPAQLPDWVTTSFEARRAKDGDNLQGWLESLRLDELREMARQRGWTVRGTRKADVAAQVAANLANPDEIAAQLARLDAEHRRVLWGIALSGGFAGQKNDDAERVALGWGSLTKHAKFETYARHLADLGLIFLGNEYDPYNPFGAFIPRLMARNYPPLLAEAMPTSERLAPQTTVTEVRGAESALVRLTLQVLSLLEQTPMPLRPPMPRPRLEKFQPHLRGWDYDADEIARLDREGRLRKREAQVTVPPPAPPLPDEVVARLEPVVGSAARLEFIYHLMLKGGLVQPGSPVTPWRQVRDLFLQQSEAAQRAILARSYFNLDTWSELWGVLRGSPDLRVMRNLEPLYGTLSPQGFMAELTGMRQVVLRTLAWLPDNRWIPLADVCDILRRVWPRFDQGFWTRSYWGPYAKHGNWWLTRRDTPLNPDNPRDWDRAQGEFIRALVAGPLHWLGLADVAFEGLTPTHLRLHGLSDLFWDRAETVAASVELVPTEQGRPAAPTPVHIDQDVIRVNPNRLASAGHSLLDRIAKLEQGRAHEFVYRLAPAQVHKAFESGLSLDQIEDEWATAFGEAMPDTLRQRVQAWWDSYGRLRLYRDVTIIEFGDDYALTEMKAVTSLGALMIAELSPRLVLIPQSAVAQLTQELERAGYTPQVAKT